MIPRILTGLALVAFSSQAMSQGAAPVQSAATSASSSCSNEQAGLAKVSSDFKPQLDNISKKGEDIKKDADNKSDLSVDFKVEMKEQKWVLDLPSVTMKDQRIVIGIPEVRMNTREFSFDVPETIMVAKKVGQYPETVVHGFEVTVRWRDIITHVPEVRMSRRSFKMDIPETRMKNTDIIFGLPEVRMERQEWFVKIPEFTLKKIEVAGVPVYSDFEKRGKDLEKESDEVKGQMKSSLVVRTSALYACLRTNVTSQQAVASSQMQKALAQMDESIKTLSAQGIAAATVKIVVDGKEKTLQEQRDELYAAQLAMQKKFADLLTQLDQDEKSAVGRVAAG